MQQVAWLRFGFSNKGYGELTCNCFLMWIFCSLGAGGNDSVLGWLLGHLRCRGDPDVHALEKGKLWIHNIWDWLFAPSQIGFNARENVDSTEVILNTSKRHI
jgi:hypothetical protein